jgi:hypothetical protein
MRLLARRLALALGLLTLASCAVQQQGALVDRKLAEADPAKLGVVVGSFGIKMTGREGGSQVLLLRRLESRGEDVTVLFQANMDDFPPDVRDNRSQATIFALKLPEGWYEIYNFRQTRPGVYGSSTTFSARGDFSFLFQIEAGKASYVGEYLSVPTNARNIFGTIQIPSPYFEVGDQRARDFAFAQAKLPEFDYGNARDFIPDVVALKHPLFSKATP